jgi:hypothetical protein
MNRRQFLFSAGVAGAACLSSRSRAGAAPDDKLILSSPLTHSDWMLKPNIEPGEAGVRHMLDACKAAGWSRVMWRVCDAGQATYRSKLMRPGLHPEPDNIFNPQTDEGRSAVKRLLPNLTPEQGRDYLEKMARIDYAAFDSLAAACAYGREIGLKVWAWVTINEDDHGWGWPSEFTKAHPQFRWVRRDGRPYHSQLSFAFEEVRKYKLALLEELLAYPIDGVFLDWIRTGDIRDNPQNTAEGIADYGYEAPNVEAFKKQYGVDPHAVAVDDERWAHVRAEPQTRFMRAARGLQKTLRPGMPLAVLVGHTWHYRGAIDRIAGNLRGLLLDVPAWAEEGLMDAAVAAGYYRDGVTAAGAWQELRKDAGGKVDVWTYAWVPQNVGEFERDFALARSLGANQILFWEADYIDDRSSPGELKRAMSARARW